MIKKIYLHFLLVFLGISLSLSYIQKTYANSGMNTSNLELHGFYPKEIFKGNDYNQKHLLKEFDDLSFDFYNVTYDTLEVQNQGIKINSAVLNKNHIEALHIAQQNNTPIRCNVFSKMESLKNILPFEQKRQIVIQEIMDLMNEEIIQDSGLYWDGIVIDFEELRNTTLNSTSGINESVLYEGKFMSQWYVQFLQELKEQLTTSYLDKDLYVAVSYSGYYDGYNYREIGDIADKVIVMAHDYEPKKNIKKSDVLLYLNHPEFVDSLSSISKVDQAMKELTNKDTGIKDPKKIILQISFGTAQWKFLNIEKAGDWDLVPADTIGIYSTPSYDQIYQRMISQLDPGVPNYIEFLGSPYILYYNTADKSYNFILYEDSRSVEEKIKKAREAGIGGISLWSLGRIPNYQNIKEDNYTKELYLNIWEAIVQSIRLKSTTNSISYDKNN